MAGTGEVRQFTVTCPPGTAINAPQLTNLAMPVRVVDNIRVRIPDGPNGFMGFAIGAAGVPIVPVGAGQWIVASDEVIDWPQTDQIDSGAWQVQMYNTGIFPHTIYLQFTVHLPDAPVAVAPAQPLVIAPVAVTPVSVGSAITLALPAPPELT